LIPQADTHPGSNETAQGRYVGAPPAQADDPGRAINFARSLAVVIGINDYADPIPALKTPGNDARRMAEVLQQQQKYDVLPPLTADVTRRRLVELFTDTLPALHLGSSDRLLVYFAGHGTERPGAGGEPEYYLVPQDAHPDDQDSFLPMRLMRDALLKLKCRHLLLVLDCCFAGGFGRLRSIDDPPDKIYRQRFDFYVRSPAWQVIASAAHDETALDTAGGYVFGRRAIGDEADHSPFASALFAALEGEADVNPASQEGEPAGDGLITATELYTWVRDRVQALAGNTHRQSPGLWPLPNHQAGEYVFSNPERAMWLEDALPLTAGANPYRGLSSYDEQHSQLFFGRAKQIAALAEKVAAQPFIAVLGVSGTGKSSLAKAGLIPALGGSHRAGEPPDPRQVGMAHWLTLPPFRPTAEPVASLAKLLADHLPGYADRATSLVSDPAGLAAMVTAWSTDHPGARLALVIDQFEELVTLCDDGEQRQHFQALLANALEAVSDALRVVITLRTDFEPPFAQGPLKTYWSREARFVVTPMSQDDLRQVILGPAWTNEIYFDPHALVDELINEVIQAPGGLPLLSFALSEMYLRYIESGRADRTLRREDYNAVGGVIGSLRSSANKIWDDLGPAHRATMERLMLRMIAVGGGEVARRRVAWPELDYGEGENQRRDEVIRRLEEARLVVRDKSAQWVEPAHDALVSGWDRLMAWKLKAASYLPLQRELAPVALHWQAADAKTSLGLLWDKDPRLPQMEETLWPTASKHKGVRGRLRWMRQVLAPKTDAPVDTQWVNGAELEFVQASVRARTAFWRRTVAITLTVMVALAGLTTFALIQRGAANANAAEAGRQKVTAEANAEEANRQKATAVANEQIAKENQAKAEREARIALSRQLAAQSTTELNKDQSELALLLSIEAGYTAETLEAYDAIRAAIADTHSRILSELTGVSHMVWSPDGTKILITGDDLAKVLNGETLVEWVRLEDPKGLYEPRWNSTGDRILARHGNVVRVWSAQTGELQLNLDHAGAFVEDAVWSRDGNRILSASTDDGGDGGGDLDNSGWVWDAQTGKDLVRLVGHTSEVNMARWSPDERLILTASHDGGVRVWDANTGLLLTTLNDNTSVFQPDRAIWSPRGDRILAYEGNHIWIWDTATQQKQILFDIEQGDLFTVEWRPGNDGQILASDVWNRAYVVDSDQGKPLFTLEDISTAVWSQDGSRILTAGPDQSAVVWNADTGQEIMRLQHSAEVREATWANDERRILTTDADGVARVWDMNSAGYEINPLHVESSPAVTWSKNGGEIYLSANDSVGVWNPDKDEFSWGSEQADIRQRLEKIPGIIYIGKQYAFTGVVTGTDTTNAFTLTTLDANTVSELIRIPAVVDFKESPDESHVLARHTTGIGTIYDVANGEQVSNLEEPLADSWTSIWSADNQTILVSQPKVDRRPTVSLFDVSTGRRIAAGLEENLPEGEFILQGEYVAVSSEQEKAVSIWNARNGANLLTLHGVRFASWAKDGKRILVIGDDKSASIWDVERKTQLIKLTGNSGDINQAMWSADEKRVLTSSVDNTVLLWDAITGQTLMRLENANSPEWSRDNRMILIKSKDGITTTLQVLYSVMDGLVSKACQKAPRNMTWDEWNRIMSGPYRPTCPEAFITPDVIGALQSQAKTGMEAGDLVMARAILTRLNGWLVESGQLTSYGADSEALLAEVQKTLVPDTSPHGTPEGDTP
jgi:WD40 repeat protein